MKSISEFTKSIDILFTDIDDTLTLHGKLIPEGYSALWTLNQNQIDVVPITGRPAGWCELIARLWPVKGVIGENGAFYFSYQNNKMKRIYFKPPTELSEDQKKLEVIKNDILATVPGSALSSDQFCRLYDLAIDFCEDVKPLPKNEIDRIVAIFKKHGATAKVSSIHVNGWFGDFNKLKMALSFLKNEYHLQDIQKIQSRCAFIGDSPNDEPMFEYFDNALAVANIKNFIQDLKHLPKYVTHHPGGLGFEEMTKQLISTKK